MTEHGWEGDDRPAIYEQRVAVVVLSPMGRVAGYLLTGARTESCAAR
jgi:hypothetical protein